MSKDSFVPDGYQIPKGNSNYMKFEQGDNRFRILSKPIIGWEDWKDKKPIRFRMHAKPAAPVDPKKEIKHFWAMIVYNYRSKEIQILEITQKSIQIAIQGYAKDPDWDNPFGYDVNVTREGEGMETEYTVSPKPHKAVEQEIIDAFFNKPCNLEALFDGADPFGEYRDYTIINDGKE